MDVVAKSVDKEVFFVEVNLEVVVGGEGTYREESLFVG